MNNIVKQAMLPNTIHFYNTMSNDNTEVMRINRDGVWVNPNMLIDDTAKAVLAALDSQIKVLVQAEREACAKVCDDLALPPDVARSNASIWEVATLDCAEAIRARSNT